MFRGTITLFILGTLIACSPQGRTPEAGREIPTTSPLPPFPAPTDAPSNPQGGQDSGGGNTKGSTKEFILEIFGNTDRLVDELTEITTYLYEKEEFFSKQDPFVKEWNHKYKSTQIDLRKTLTNLVVKPECFDLNHKASSATATQFSTDDEICMSISYLRKIPPESLRKEIHALLLHEISHMMGYKAETEPNIIQNIVLNNYNSLLFYNKDYFDDALLLSTLHKTKSSLTRAIRFSDEDFINGKIKNDNDFLDAFSSMKWLVPTLLNRVIALQTIVETRAQVNPLIQVKESEDLTTEIIKTGARLHWLGYAFTKITIMKDHLPEYKNIKDGNYLFLKRELQEFHALLQKLDAEPIVSDMRHLQQFVRAKPMHLRKIYSTIDQKRALE